MTTERIILTFDQNVGHRKMAELMKLGYLWVNFSDRNQANVNALWATMVGTSDMVLSIETRPQVASIPALEMWAGSALEHFPNVRFLDVLGFDDEAACDAVMEGFEFKKSLALTNGAFSYERAPPSGRA